MTEQQQKKRPYLILEAIGDLHYGPIHCHIATQQIELTPQEAEALADHFNKNYPFGGTKLAGVVEPRQFNIPAILAAYQEVKAKEQARIAAYNARKAEAKEKKKETNKQTKLKQFEKLKKELGVE